MFEGVFEMGEAKRRGTYEQRKAEGEIKRQQQQAELNERLEKAKRRGIKTADSVMLALLASAGWRGL